MVITRTSRMTGVRRSSNSAHPWTVALPSKRADHVQPPARHATIADADRVKRAVQAVWNGQVAESLDLIDPFLAGSDDHAVNHLVGVVWQLLGYPDVALRYLLAANNIAPGRHYTQVEIAQAYATDGRTREALEWYSRAVASDSTDETALTRMALLLNRFSDTRWSELVVRCLVAEGQAGETLRLVRDAMLRSTTNPDVLAFWRRDLPQCEP